jgi:hypothetical protein
MKAAVDAAALAEAAYLQSLGVGKITDLGGGAPESNVQPAKEAEVSAQVREAYQVLGLSAEQVKKL